METELNDEEMALKFTQKALAVLPSYLPAIRSARRAFSRIERWSMVCRLLESEVRHSAIPAARTEALADCLELFWSRFKRPDDAMRCLNNIVGFRTACFFQPILAQQMRRLIEQRGLSASIEDDVHRDAGSTRGARLGALEALDPKMYEARVC